MKTKLTLMVSGLALAVAGCASNTGSTTPPPATASTAMSPDANTAAAATMPDSGAMAAAPTNPMVGGAEMYPTKTIVENASAAPNLTTLVAAVKAADLAGTLSGPGPFTVFAPTNDAFSRLAPGTVDTLMKPENKATLVKVLTYHVVPGTITAADLMSRIQAGGGTTTLTTVEGEPLTATMSGQAVVLTDVHGNKSYIGTADVRQSNGIVHVVNGVLLPTLS